MRSLQILLVEKRIFDINNANLRKFSPSRVDVDRNLGVLWKGLFVLKERAVAWNDTRDLIGRSRASDPCHTRQVQNHYKSSRGSLFIVSCLGTLGNNFRIVFYLLLFAKAILNY